MSDDQWHVRIAAVQNLCSPYDRRRNGAGRPWLSYHCPARQMIGDVDVRTLDRHPGGSIESLIPHLDCPRCPKKLIGLRGARSVGSA